MYGRITIRMGRSRMYGRYDVECVEVARIHVIM
jgi:hypothetical protein